MRFFQYCASFIEATKFYIALRLLGLYGDEARMIMIWSEKNGPINVSINCKTWSVEK